LKFQISEESFENRVVMFAFPWASSRKREFVA
jgi:hypothetical protein